MLDWAGRKQLRDRGWKGNAWGPELAGGWIGFDGAPKSEFLDRADGV